LHTLESQPVFAAAQWAHINRGSGVATSQQPPHIA